MIKLVRIDYRLLHGQVVFAWTRALDIDHIIVANANAMRRRVCLYVIKSGKTRWRVAGHYHGGTGGGKTRQRQAGSQKVMVVLGNTAETLAFVEKVPGISVINYGGIAQKEGAQQFGKAIYLTEQEIADSQALKAKGIRLEMRQVPAHSAELLNDKL